MPMTPWLDRPEPLELTNWQVAYTEHLHRLAEFLREHPEFIPPSGLTVDIFIYDKQDSTAVEQLAEAARTLGTVEKDAAGNSFFLIRKRFGPHSLEVNAPRNQVCERKVVDVRRVPERVVEAHDEEIVEWECHPILAERSPKETGLADRTARLNAAQAGTWGDAE